MGCWGGQGGDGGGDGSSICVSKNLVYASERFFRPVFWRAFGEAVFEECTHFPSSVVCCAASPGQVLRQHQAAGHQAVATAAAHRQVHHVGRAGGHQHAKVGTVIINNNGNTMTVMLAAAVVTTITIMITK